MDDVVSEFRKAQAIFLFSQTFGLAVGPTQPPIYWFPGFFPCGYSSQSVMFADHLI